MRPNRPPYRAGNMKVHRSLGMSVPVLVCLGLSTAAQDDQKAAPSLAVRSMTVDTQVAGDGGSTQTLHIEVRAGNDAGALQVSQTSIPYDATGQEIAIVEAHTLKADGKTLPVDATAIYDQAPR